MPAKEVYASQFRALFIHFLCMSMQSRMVLVLFGLVEVNSFSSLFYADDIALLAQAESPWFNLEQAAGGISLHVNANKTEYTCFK